MATKSRRKSGETGDVLRDLLTFERLLTGPVIHLIYWAGLGVIVLGAFGSIGAAIGVALKEQEIVGKLLAIPLAVAGVLICFALVLLWRSFCEFYVAVFRIADDLKGLRIAAEREVGGPVNTGGPPQRPFAG
ncbi:DUF4282 domain-containing protein [Caulobacter sp. NIBR1757]|uniref:DUF4282 domain-containing protein n=1 Tax=Caulobacter sp. NIBR1757 TaxID=3016000 RepID=UPI0022F028A6|nr:DUF4282 domain-containing protein [Caulobacter sp. NIBR1757]WGM40533.1 hypothetical protein AMEJIAPC_03478 [Caulobacter sp. NIBR1757]